MEQTDQSFEDLVGEPHSARQRRPKKYSVSGTDYWVFGIAGALALAFIVWGFVTPEGLGKASDVALDWVITNTGWLFVIAASVFALFVIVVAAKTSGASH